MNTITTAEINSVKIYKIIIQQKKRNTGTDTTIRINCFDIITQ
jgi:hypothetical protein